MDIVDFLLVHSNPGNFAYTAPMIFKWLKIPGVVVTVTQGFINNPTTRLRFTHTGNIVCEDVDACSLPDGDYSVSRLSIDGGVTWPVSLSSRAQQPAGISIVNNTISWPDNARYEVQFILTGEIVCKGGSSCTVPDGAYYVNSYFDDGSNGGSRQVIGNPGELIIDESNFEYALKVDGLIINWSFDGYYQVQDAPTYQEICNGTDFCIVPKVGRYTVINHSLGLRTELEVSDRSGPTVVNNTISWLDDGWYQVENRVTGDIVCQGGLMRTVPDGIYWVIRFYDGGNA